MAHRYRRSVIVPLAVALLVAACSGDGDSAGSSEPTTRPSSTSIDPDEPLVPIDTVAPTQAPTTTAAPTTTRPPLRLPDRMAEPNPQWVPVEIPAGDALRPSTVQRLVDDPASRVYDISPDGNYLARIDAAGDLCLSSTSDPSDEVCDSSIEVSFATWSPDSSTVLFNFVDWTQFRSGTLGALAIDGTVTALVEPTQTDSPSGGASAAGFVDADTVLYSRIVTEPSLALEIHTVGIDGSDDRLLGSLGLGTAETFLPTADLVAGTSLFTGITMAIPGGNGVWRYDAESDAFGRIVTDPDAIEPFEVVGSTPVAVRGGLLLSVEGSRFAAFSSYIDDAQFFDLTTTDGATSVPIADLDDDYFIMSAALSPDGAHVAVYEVYRGDDEATADSASVGRVSIATTASVSAGDPAWQSIDEVGPGGSARNLDRSGTVVTWPTLDRLHVELLDAALVIEVVPA